MTKRALATAVITTANIAFTAWWCQIPGVKGAALVAYYFMSYCLAVGALLLFPKSDYSGMPMHAVILVNVAVIISPVLLIFWGVCATALLGGV